MFTRKGWHAIVPPFVFILLTGLASAAHAALKPEQVPTFQIRAHVAAAAATAKFAFRFEVPGATVQATGSDWSDWLKFEHPQIEATLKGYPAIYMDGFPVVVKLHVDGVVDPTVVEAELKFDESGDVVKLPGELFGPTLGILLWRDGDKPRAATMAQFNRRYWPKTLTSQRPQKFPIVDRFIGGDDDRRDWQEGIEHLAQAGFSGIMLPPSRPLRDLLVKDGLHRTAWAVYNPPGYAFDFELKDPAKEITAWAEKEAQPYRAAGYAPDDMALFAMSDEPGWYYPAMFQSVTTNAVALARFRDYLRAQKLKPIDVGAKNWDTVQPLGRSHAINLPSRRLFYWTARFFAWDSARHFAASARGLEKSFQPGLPIFTNWNFFSGRLWVPGPVANNSAKQDPDAAMGGHDWFEFGKLRGGTMLWTEDWFPDSMGYQWSFYCSKLRCAADKGGVSFGGYVIPRTAGDRVDGILQKILCVIGSGGKAIKYFVFGPEYNFPGNCYSENVRVLPKMAEAHGMIAAAEEVLWPGRRPRAEVAILAPRSAELWDAMGIPIPNQIQDATNNHLNNDTVDYMAEVFDLYLALQHANIPVDFVDEDDLTRDGLKSYRVLYVTEPNIPIEGQRELGEWVRAGGTIVTVTGAGARDRYDEPCRALSDATGISEKPRARLLVPSLAMLKEVGRVNDLAVIGARGYIAGGGTKVEAKFADGTPAIVRRDVGRGHAIHFAWLPGISYIQSQTGTADRLPVGFSEALRNLITAPTLLAKVQPPVTVDLPMVETPLLVSPSGAAVTLLNWSGATIQRLDMTVRVPFKVKTVASVKRGPLAFQATSDGVRCVVRLDAADIVTLQP